MKPFAGLFAQYSATFNSPWECRIGLTGAPPCVCRLGLVLAFNSPWECRIGLTWKLMGVEPLTKTELFQFPVGMSNRSYMDGCDAYA